MAKKTGNLSTVTIFAIVGAVALVIILLVLLFVNDNSRVRVDDTLPGNTPATPTNQETLLIGRANSQTGLVQHDVEGRIIGDITHKKVDDVRLTKSRFELVDDMYVHASIVIHNPRPDQVDVACLYGAYSGGGSVTYNYVVSPGDNEFVDPFSTATYEPGLDVFDHYNFQIKCSIGHDPLGGTPRAPNE